MKHPLESLSNLTDDELRLEVAKKMWPDMLCHFLFSNFIHADNNGRDGKCFVDPISPEGAFRLMVGKKISVDMLDESSFAYAQIQKNTVVAAKWHPATLKETARAICEAYLLMERT
jgi:hypothetical protein